MVDAGSVRSLSWLVAAATLCVQSICCGQECTADHAANIREAIRTGAESITLEVGQARFVLVRIPAGQFDLGSPKSDVMAKQNEFPARRIHITAPFYIGATEVSQKQYSEVIGEHLNSFTGDELPVEGLTLAEARDFCDALSRESGIVVTLPTEAQWEYACRAGTSTRYYSGETADDLARVAWFEGNSGDKSHKCGMKAPNAWGLHDMLGNVWEPCLDGLPPYDKIAKTDPVGQLAPVIGRMRGGCWQDQPQNCRAAKRMATHDLAAGMGIRIVVNVIDNEPK